MVYCCLCHAVALTPLSRFGELKPSHIPIELQTTALMHRDFGLAPNSTLLVHLIKEITAENRAIFSRCLYPDPGSNRDGFPHRCLRPTRLPIPPSGHCGDKGRYFPANGKIYFVGSVPAAAALRFNPSMPARLTAERANMSAKTSSDIVFMSDRVSDITASDGLKPGNVFGGRLSVLRLYGHASRHMSQP